MAIKSKTIPPVNLTLSDQVVYLTSVIGNAQIGGNQVKFKNDAKTLAKGDIKGLMVGNAASLRGKTLEIITNILDVNPGTNNIIITHHFQGCDPANVANSDSVNLDGDIFSFITSYNFV